MKISIRYTILSAASLMLSVVYGNCSKESFTATPSLLAESVPGTTVTPPGPVVCDPFGGTTATTQTQGLIAQGITYIDQASLAANQTPDSVINSSVENLLSKAGTAPVVESQTNLFLSSINFPAMYFSQGFKDSSTDQALVDKSNKVLTSYFGFRLKSVFIAGDWAEGDYEFAALTDDGSIVTLTGASSDGSDYVINNDGEHSMELGCSARTVHISANSKIPFTMDYMQGPPITIGLMLLYRKHTATMSGATLQEPLCGGGAHSDSYFFLDHDSNSNAVTAIPQAPYKQLTGTYDSTTGTGGWKVVEPNHYVLPSNYSNPCATTN